MILEQTGLQFERAAKTADVLVYSEGANAFNRAFGSNHPLWNPVEVEWVSEAVWYRPSTWGKGFWVQGRGTESLLRIPLRPRTAEFHAEDPDATAFAKAFNCDPTEPPQLLTWVSMAKLSDPRTWFSGFYVQGSVKRVLVDEAGRVVPL